MCHVQGATHLILFAQALTVVLFARHDILLEVLDLDGAVHIRLDYAGEGVLLLRGRRWAGRVGQRVGHRGRRVLRGRPVHHPAVVQVRVGAVLRYLNCEKGRGVISILF